MQLFSELEPNTTILTPNRRLSATLLKKFNQFQLSYNKLSMTSLDILPYTSWIERLWKEYSLSTMDNPYRLLTVSQEWIIWEEILKKYPENEALLQISSLADMAKAAYNTLQQWQLSLDNDALKLTQDGCAFIDWAKSFNDLCHEKQWIDNIQLQNEILKSIENAHICLPESILVIGFSEFSPLQSAIFDACQSNGVKLSYIESYHEYDSITKKMRRLGLKDQDTEIYTMARFAHQQWLEHKLTKSVGCIVPNLDKIRERVLRIFLEVFTENNQFTLDHTTLPFNISAGKNLTQYPIIDMALEILNLNKQYISTQTFSRLLRSPFLHDAEKEHISRHLLIERLNKKNIVELTISDLITNKNLKIQSFCPKFTYSLSIFLSLLSKKYFEKALVSDWITFFMELLSTLGWPGERSLNSQEYQVVKRFLDLLAEYRSFDSILGEISYSDALHYLIRLCKKTIYQTQSPDAPIQILGLLEAAPLPFDITWVMGLDDTTWPPSIKQNPLIPASLQKEYNMPHATADRELNYSRKLTEQLKQNANDIIFSYSLTNLDAHLQPSALIRDLPEINLNDIILPSHQSLARIIFVNRNSEKIQDEKAPAINETEMIQGGVSILKLQAACPFKAFAELRLHAAKIESPSIGLRATDRGVFLHKALEIIWKEIQTSDQLKQYQDDELRIHIKNSVIEAYKILQYQKSWYLELEVQRLENILWLWLQYEKIRPSFKVIFNEQIRATTIGPIPIHLRIDRIDALENGDQLIIDYKTGKNKNSLKMWFDQRMLEPQLPLYCLSESNRTVGIAFAEVHPELISLRGCSKYNLEINTIQTLEHIKASTTTSWEEQLTLWRNDLEQTASDFFEGVATVSPKQNDICNHCHLHSLCRIHDE